MELEFKRAKLAQTIAVLAEKVKQLELLISEQEETRIKIFETAKEHLGEDVSPREDVYGCAESVNAIVNEATDRPIGGDLSTYRMFHVLRSNSFRFRQVDAQKSNNGDIIISPTGYGNGNLKNGHVGIICIENGIIRIMSNNSESGKWETTHTLDQWVHKYKQIGGFPVLFYRVIS